MGETHLGPFGVQLLCNGPSDRMIVGDSEDQSLFTVEHAHRGSSGLKRLRQSKFLQRQKRVPLAAALGRQCIVRAIALAGQSPRQWHPIDQ